MSADQLTPAEIARAVLAVLSGTPLEQAAANIGLAPTDLTDAVQTYQQAGLTALRTHTERDWYQASLEFAAGTSLEQATADELAPRLHRLQNTRAITSWWFIRKPPGLRLRITPGTAAAPVVRILDELTSIGVLASWRRTLYEPEDAAFGSRPAMDIAHELFCADSQHIVSYLRHPQPPIGRRELSLLLCTTLFRAAGHDWFECGDIWHRVTQLRPSPDSADPLDQLTDQVHTLLTCDISAMGPLFGTDGPLTFAACWATAFHYAGDTLAAASSVGTLYRGSRAILAQHVLFHWNRLGLSTRTQSLLAHAATSAVFER